MLVREYCNSDYNEWKKLRMELWPETSESEHEEEMKIISSGGKFDSELGWNIFVAENKGEIIGFAEVSLREKLDNFSEGSIGYLEGWFVSSIFRKKGIGKSLVTNSENWAKENNCIYMASDVEFDNSISLEAHQKLGYRIVGKDTECHILIKDI